MSNRVHIDNVGSVDEFWSVVAELKSKYVWIGLYEETSQRGGPVTLGVQLVAGSRGREKPFPTYTLVKSQGVEKTPDSDPYKADVLACWATALELIGEAGRRFPRSKSVLTDPKGKVLTATQVRDILRNIRMNNIRSFA
jgi:hypothetical protein